jgi:cyanate permease
MAPALLVASVLAHQGGWDEILLVAAPIALLAFLLWRANKKAARLESERDERPS